MSTLNDLWFEYLRGEGYTGSINDMLQQALQDETRIVTGKPNS